MITPVIMAGGSGTRLWPLSRSLYPKQFLPLTEDRTMFQVTAERLRGLTDDAPLLVCNEEHRFIAAEQMRAIGLTSQILLEPVGRNTAPAVALAALHATAGGDDPLLSILAADHLIQDEEGFRDTVLRGLSFAEAGAMVTFGIVPTAAETGYGYIQQGAAADADSIGCHVKAFVEKPDHTTAERYLTSGDYVWNSGMFLFRASRYLSELEAHRPDILASCRAAMAKIEPDRDFVRVDAERFADCPSESIDYAVMEKTDRAVVIPMDVGWNDIGAWSALWETADKDTDGNCLQGDVLTHKRQNTYVRSDKRLVATVGVSDLVIVDTTDALLVASQDQVQHVKSIVNQLNASDRPETKLHRQVYRPWGNYDSVDAGDRFQVKRITVNPGAKLSVQMHHHRAEHWIVVAGTAHVGRDNDELVLTENESVYLPVGCVHWLENRGKIALELIEVQTGSYLGEDDIVRFEDKYGRVESR
ncbi:mannose-1-phosphate guanylyltransferase/mannose-6-phosphate isomerase [Shewanella sp.]|uniref:mannose-1-phosphate guanylyltransferase/mannose-6-phosphate isomerase n=1 Tax=Shewanella sp. TaxID=50422 RepID=UPI004048045F